MQRPVSEFEIVTVKSGACTLRSRRVGQTFHPVVGPMIEAQALHVRQQRLVERAAAQREPFIIWDVGLGGAANAVAAIEAFAGFSVAGAAIELHSFDYSDEPLRFALEHREQLTYLQPHEAALRDLLAHGAARCGVVQWHFQRGDFRERLLDLQLPAPQAILYDPYSPSANAELWTLEHFTALRQRLRGGSGSLLTNYTRSTAVRVTLLLAGFFVGPGDATGEKNETTMAADRLDLLASALDQRWLARVRSSTHSAPLRAGGSGAPISDEDLKKLLAHPQFAGPQAET
jgi:tRNA U34 5-methylaminomethyl-2-thiouridine-forming methyltransferase MnmC